MGIAHFCVCLNKKVDARPWFLLNDYNPLLEFLFLYVDFFQSWKKLVKQLKNVRVAYLHSLVSSSSMEEFWF